MFTKNIKIDLKKTIPLLILIGLWLTPLFTIDEVIHTITTGGRPIRSETLVFIKLIKDCIFAFIILITIISKIKSENNKFNKYFILFSIIVFISIIATTLLTKEYIYIIAGLRWSMAIFLIFSLTRYVDLNLQIKISKVLKYLFFLNFLIQIYQVLGLSNYWGTNLFGFNARNPGIFAENNTASFFILTTLYYNIFFFSKKKISTTLLVFLSPISIFLTGSGTGMIVIFILFAYLLYKKLKKDLRLELFYCLILLVFFASFLYFMPSILSRNAVYTSLLIRVKKIFLHLEIENIFFSKNFGFATNTGNLLQAKFDLENSFIIADSTLVSLMVNTGLVSSILFYAGFIYLKNNTTVYNTFMIVFALSSLTCIIFEAFPLNLLLAVNIAYFYKQKIK